MKTKEILEVLKVLAVNSEKSGNPTIPEMDSYWIGKKVIVRTYSAGVHYGKIRLKSGSEVILEDSRRLWYWKTTNKGISLSEIANAGVNKESKVCQCVSLIWLDAIELIVCQPEAINSIEAQDDYKS